MSDADLIGWRRREACWKELRGNLAEGLFLKDIGVEVAVVAACVKVCESLLSSVGSLQSLLDAGLPGSVRNVSDLMAKAVIVQGFRFGFVGSY